MRIDTEKYEVVELGLADIGHYFEVDSDGNIYLVSPKSKENVIFKFDRFKSDGLFAMIKNNRLYCQREKEGESQH